MINLGGISDAVLALGDEAGLEIYREAFMAIVQARQDGREAHAPDSWRKEDIIDRLMRARQHAHNAYWSLSREHQPEPSFEEMSHAICDLAIAMALVNAARRKGQSD